MSRELAKEIVEAVMNKTDDIDAIEAVIEILEGKIKEVHPTQERIMQGKEPTIDEVVERMPEFNGSFYNTREKMREEAYGGKPPDYPSWGDYWKSR